MGVINTKGIDLIVTVNNYDLLHFSERVLEKYNNCSCDILRINLAKEIELEGLYQILTKYRNKIYKKMLFDLALPKIKPRLFFNNKSLYTKTIQKGTIYSLCYFESHKDSCDFFVGKGAKINASEGQVLFSGDGEGSFSIIRTFSDYCLIKANQSFSLINGKALNGFTLTAVPEDIGYYYKCFIDTFQPDFTAYSFIETREEIEKIRSKIHRESSVLVSKIETAVSIANLNEIIDSSDVIMLGRGDLGFYGNISKIGLYQKEVLKKAKSTLKPIYVATDILSSIKTKRIPSRADITDVTQMILDGVDGLILPAGIDDIENALELLRAIEREVYAAHNPSFKANYVV